MKFRGTFWNKETRQNETFTFQSTKRTFDDVRSRMRNRNPTEEQVVEAFISEVTRSMGGRKTHRVEKI